jgi:hypothetical protein
VWGHRGRGDKLGSVAGPAGHFRIVAGPLTFFFEIDDGLSFIIASVSNFFSVLCRPSPWKKLIVWRRNARLNYLYLNELKFWRVVVYL